VKKAMFLFVLMSLASFTLFAQEQEGVVAKFSSDFGFKSAQSSLEVTHHFKFGGVSLFESSNDRYVFGMEDQVIEKGMDAKTKADAYVFNPDEITYQNIKDNVFDVFGFGISGKSFYERAGLQFFWRFAFGGLSISNNVSENVDPLDLLSRQKFVPNGNRDYGNMILITAVASTIIPELTFDQIDKLTTKSKVNTNESGGYIPLSERPVEEAYDIISTEHNNQGFDFTLTPDNINEADGILKGTVLEPTAQEKRIEAERQKLKAFVRWTYTLPETLLVYNFLASTFEYQNRPGVNPSYVVNFARTIAEWRLANPNGLWKNYFKKSMAVAAPTNKAYWPDLYVGLKTDAFSRDEGSFAFNPDVMAKAGFGYNFDKSFIYLTGLYGVNGYEADLNTNIRFVKNFEVNAGAYYYQGGRVRGVIKPNFILFNDFIEIGGGMDFDVLPSTSSSVFGEIFIAKCFGVGIIHGLNSGQTSITATIKF